MRPPNPYGDTASLDTETANRLLELEQPTKPVTFPSCTNANLPPAASWPLGGIIVTDKNCLAISTLVTGVWTWLRADGSAI